MRLRDLKAKLLFFFVRRLRLLASSVERYVSQSQSKESSVKESNDDDSPHPVKQIAPLRAGGPPKHWVDLVRLKAPELLSSAGTNLRPPRAEVDQTSTSFELEREDVGESDEKENYVSEEAQPRVPRQNHARVPGVRQKLAKAKTFTRPRPLSLKPLKKPNQPPPQEDVPTPKVDSIEQSSALVDRNSTTVFQTDNAIPLSELNRPVTQKPPASESTDIHQTGSKSQRRAALQNVGFPELRSAINNKKTESPVFGTTADYGHSQTSRQTNPDVSSQDASRATAASRSRESASSTRFVERTDRSREPSEIEPKPKLISFVTTYRDSEDMIPRLTSSASRATLSRDDQRSPPFVRKSQTIDSRLSSQIVSQALAVRSAEFSKAESQSSDVNVPALMDEETMNRASAVRFSDLASGENPWPDLPQAIPLELAEELAANERELDRYRRLEREQRGTLWNE